MSVRRHLVGWLAVLVSAAPAFGQEPDPPITDPDVTPAQFTLPAGPPPTAAPVAGGVADPPTPVVRIQVRVPANVGEKKDLTYKLVVTNTSAADAYRVVVRNPVPDGVAQVVRAEPKPDKQEAGAPGSQLPKALVWSIGTLPKGEKREIEVVFRPAADAKEVRNQAFVAFEHGQAVVTKIDRHKLAVRKTAPKQATAGDAIPVRVEVTNPGRVPVAGVELVEDVSKGFEFTADGDAERTNSPQQRLWKLGTLRPGERKVVEYRLTAKEAAELLTTSVVRSPDSPDGDRAEFTTRVVAPGLDVKVTGPPTVAGGERGEYKVVVTNTGSLPFNTIQLTAVVPAGCQVVRMTNRGQVYRDRVVWTLPVDRDRGPLKPGQTAEVRFALTADTSGQRTVRVAADPGHGLEKSSEAVTVFQGTAVLQWNTDLNPPSLTVGRQGQIAVRVTNRGSDPAKNVRLRVELPNGVRLKEATPQNQPAKGEVVFDAVTVPAGKSEVFTITYVPEEAGQAVFLLKLSSDTLGDKPMTADKSVTVTGGR